MPKGRDADTQAEPVAAERTRTNTPRRLKRIDSASLTELVYRSIRDSIVAGRFEMGERIVEKRLAEELEVSRAPIREALRRLVEEGLLVERPRHGTFVRELGPGDFVDLYNLRIAIEGAAIGLVTRRQPPLKDLESKIERMERAADRENLDELVNLELSFHAQLCELSDNEFLIHTFQSVAALIRMALAVDDASYKELKDIADEHRPLLAAIEAGDQQAAVRTLADHIVSSLGPVLDRLGADPADLLVQPGR